VPDVKLIIERAKSPDAEFSIDEEFAVELGLIITSSEPGPVERVVVCDGFMLSSSDKKVFLKDLFYSNHPAIIKRSFTEVMFAGGRGGSSGRISSAERLRYNDSIATVLHANGLDEGSHYLSGTSDGRQAAYAGGSAGASQVKRLRFDDMVPCYVFTNDLTHSKRGAAGVSSYNDALYGGGTQNENRIDRIRFDDSLMTTTLDNRLSTGRHYNAAAGDRNNVCFSGGTNSSIGDLDTIEKFKYDDSTSGVILTNGLLSARQRLSGSSTEHEMIFNGHNSTTIPNAQLVAAQLEKMRFDDNVPTMILSNTYSIPTHSSTSQSNGIDTVLIAGGNRLGDGSSTDRVESVKFDDSAQLSHMNQLSQSRWGLASAQGY
jgi:hypothetical protein